MGRLATAHRQYTFKAAYALAPFGECNCEINFTYYPTKDGEDESAEIIDGRFYSNGRWISLDREETSNLHRYVEDHCLEWAQVEYTSTLESQAEDHAYQNYEDRRAGVV